MSSKLVAALGGGLWTVVLGDWDRGEDGDSETLEMLVEEVRLLGVEYCDIIVHWCENAQWSNAFTKRVQ